MNLENLKRELQFRMTRSSGKGGQHVNKVSTRVELRFDLDLSAYLTDEQKLLIHNKLSNRISAEGILHLSSQATRSQLSNKERVIERFFALISEALVKTKVRKKTNTTRAAKLKRLDKKRKQGQKKAQRKKVNFKKEVDLFL